MQRMFTIDLTGQFITAMLLCIDNDFLLCSHTSDSVSLINMENNSVEILNKVFGEVETVYRVVQVEERPEG